MWEALGQKESLTTVDWPAFDEKALVQDEITIVIQFNGKLKERLQVASGLDKAALEELVDNNEAVQALLEGKEVVKKIVVPNKLVNFVVK